MIVFAFPAIIVGTTLLELERAFDWPFFIAARGGDPLLWQHLFWFFGHSEVYIISLPAAGLVSMMVPTPARTSLVGYRAVVAGLVGVGVLSFAVWAHHMFTAGLGALAKTLVSAASLAIAVPTALQVFAWLATLARGRLQIHAASLFVLGFLFIFVLGGLTGVMVAVLPFDAQVHDTYFIVAHLHYVLIGGLVFPLFAALYHWTPLVNGHVLSERVGCWAFALMFVGFNLTFFPMHIAGLDGMPRRIYTYAGDLGWNLWNGLSSAGAGVLATGIALFFGDAIRVWRRDPRPHANPWHAGTLEWLPGGNFGTRRIPQVESREPLWSRPSLAEEVPAGAHWLPAAALGRRETLATGPLHAEPRHLIMLTGDSWWPLLAGLGTAAFFLLLTVKWVRLACLFGIGGLVATLAWVWQTDLPPVADRVEVATGAWVPVAATGPRSHSWWATLILVVVDLTIFASLLFAHLHLSMRAEVCPPPGAALPANATVWTAAALFVAGALALAFAARTRSRGDLSAQPWPVGARLRSTAAVIVALLASGAATLAMVLGQAGAGLEPVRDAWSASVAALVAWQVFHAVVLALMGAYLLARIWSGRLTDRSRATLDAIALFWHGVMAQGVIGLALVQLLPRWLG